MSGVPKTTSTGATFSMWGGVNLRWKFLGLGGEIFDLCEAQGKKIIIKFTAPVLVPFQPNRHVLPRQSHLSSFNHLASRIHLAPDLHWRSFHFTLRLRTLQDSSMSPKHFSSWSQSPLFAQPGIFQCQPSNHNHSRESQHYCDGREKTPKIWRIR